MSPRPPIFDGFCEQQEAVARWMGYANADEMNAEHDALHQSLVKWTGLPSYALKRAAGLELSAWEQYLSNLEEDAVLLLQRYLRTARESSGHSPSSRP